MTCKYNIAGGMFLVIRTCDKDQSTFFYRHDTKSDKLL